MSINSLVNRAKFGLVKKSPQILLFAGIGGLVISAVMACRETRRKLDGILEEKDTQLAEIQERVDTVAKSSTPEAYTPEDAKKDTVTVYTQTAIKLGKTYAPCVALGVASVLSILASNNIMRKRNVALAAAYAAVNNSFKDYRNRVIDRFGKDIDYQLRYNIKEMEVEQTTTDSKGKEKTTTQKIHVADSNASDYVKYFTRSNPNWEKDPAYIRMFLNSQQSYATDLLRAKGHLTLNEVYRILGFNDTKAGMVVGWVYDPKYPTGDNYVEFDVKDLCIMNESGEFEEAYAIDFNVDGNIYNLMC